MTTVFILMIYLGKAQQESNMMFADINRCRYFASRVMKQPADPVTKKRYTAICKPVEVDLKNKKVRVYRWKEKSMSEKEYDSLSKALASLYVNLGDIKSGQEEIPIGSVDGEGTRGVDIIDDSRNPSVLNEQIYTPNLNTVYNTDNMKKTQESTFEPTENQKINVETVKPGLTSLLDKEKKKPVPTLPAGGQEKNKFEPKPGQIIPDFSSREPAVTEEPKSELQQKKDILNEIYINDNIENINMFKQYAFPFNNRTVGRGYVSHVLDTVSSYIPDTFDKNKLKSLLMYTADKESRFGSDEGTHKKKDIKGGTVGHGGIQQVTTKNFRNNLIFKPGPTAQKMIEQLKKEKGIDVNSFMKTKKGTDLASRKAINDFLRTPFGSNFAASIFYLNALDNKGDSGKAARKLFNSDKYNEKDFRDIYYKGSKTWKDVSSILKDDNIKESKRGGMIESDPYKRQPRFI